MSTLISLVVELQLHPPSSFRDDPTYSVFPLTPKETEVRPTKEESLGLRFGTDFDTHYFPEVPLLADLCVEVMDRVRKVDRTGSPVLDTCEPQSGSEGPSASASTQVSTISKRSRTFKRKFPNSIKFTAGNPTVEVTEGVLHLFKHNDKKQRSLESDGVESSLLCMLAVPAYLTIHDLFKFVAHSFERIEYLRIIRDATPNEYMVLLKFITPADAYEFYSTSNNVRYNSIEPETSHLVFVANVQIHNDAQSAVLPFAGVTELPCCAVCLERMDESASILTILCNHSFHAQCLKQWTSDTSCPVCRFAQTPRMLPDQVCSVCSENPQDDLWMCLICGFVGCGRYAGSHAVQHFERTAHTFSMQLGTNRVWDYVGDNYVHRLVQSNIDGKIVEVSNTSGQLNDGSLLLDDERKYESITLEYTYLLTSQLESQRHFFEEKFATAEREALRRIEEITGREAESAERVTILEQKLSRLTSAKSSMDKKLQENTDKWKSVLETLEEERELNSNLRANQKEWQVTAYDMEGTTKQLGSFRCTVGVKCSVLEARLETMRQQKDTRISELEEQLRDLLLNMSMSDTLKHADVTEDELAGASLQLDASNVPAASPQPGVRSKDRRRSGRRGK